MKKVLFLYGLSRVGKSTFLEVSKDFGFKVVSSSNYLSIRTTEVFKVDCEVGVKILENKDEEEWFKLTKQRSFNCRDSKIFVAESFLVPVYGRKKGIVEPSWSHVSKEDSRIIVECINDGEARYHFEVMADKLYPNEGLSFYDFPTHLAIIREVEKVKDTRNNPNYCELFYNNSSYSDYVRNIRKYLKSF